MATMKQIANLAGVSLGTVDRVLNKRGAVNAETAKKIMEIAHSLDYIPNKTARCLAIRKLNLKIGCVIISSSSDVFYGQVESSMKKKAAELEDYSITVIIKYIDPNNPSEQNRLIDELVQDGVKGIILCGYNLPETAVKIQELASHGIPVITVCTDIPNSGRIAYVGSSSRKSGRVAGQLIKLISGGYARIGIIVFGPENMMSYRDRVNSFMQYAEENSSVMEIASLEENYNDDFRSYSIVEKMLRNDPKINTILLVSAGVYGACRAIENIPEGKRPNVVCFNCVPTTREMLKKGIISAAISPDPVYQGTKPLDLMFNLLCFNTKPSREQFFVDMDIVISESLSE